MSSGSDSIHEPKRRELKTALPDVNTILFHAFERQMAPEEAMKECHDAGAKFVTLEQVEEHFAELERLKEKWIIPANEYLKKKAASGE